MTTDSQPYTWTFCPDDTLQVNSVATSDNGNTCVFGTSNEFDEGKFETFCFDGTGKLQWKAPVSDQKTYQGIFWTAVSGDGQYVASGGENSKTDGFLNAYKGENGDSLLHEELDSRINQVSLSEDGQYLAACYGKSLSVYQLNNDKSEYLLIKTDTVTGFKLNSCEINRKGNVVVASGIAYEDEGSNTVTTGKVFSYTINNGELQKLGDCVLPTGSMRVAITSSGKFWAASLHDGSCVLIDYNAPTTPQWKCAPEGVSLSLAYAVDITETENSEVYVACGANVHDQKSKGLLYLVKSSPAGGQYQGEVKWTAAIQRSVNPGVSLDQNANYVTATDGQPYDHNKKETPGTFYLFNAENGSNAWTYDTKLMNWPMVLSYDGTCAFGGSDAGSVYYWKLS